MNSGYSYTIELNRWGISNSFTNPDQTIDGINRALEWAYNSGFRHVMLPKGNYLLNVAGKSIFVQSDTIFDLGGSHLKAAPNSAPSYAVIVASDVKNAVIRNGIIQGDRHEHDYSAGSTSHEWGVGIVARGKAEFITIENMEVYDTTGDGINTEGRYNQLEVVYRRHFEPGFIHPETGQPEDNAEWIRSSARYSLNHPLIRNNRFFGFYGNGYGQLNFNGMRHYNLYFYKADGTFVMSIVNQPFFESVPLVEEADYVRIAVKTTMPSETFDRLAEFRSHEQPANITIRSNRVHHTRRCGMALGEGRYVLVENNIIHDIKGTAPHCGIDVEDGNWLNQHYTIRNNQFYNNYMYDLILYSGKYMTVENNRFRSTCTSNNNVEEAHWKGNQFEQTRLLVSGECIVEHNYFKQSYLQLAGTGQKLVNHCMFHNSHIDFMDGAPYVSTVQGCKFYADHTKAPFAGFVTRLMLRGQPFTMNDCEISGLDVLYTTSALPGLQNDIIFNNVTFRGVNQIGLPSGRYTNCRFIDTPFMNKSGSLRGDLSFRNCQFRLSSNGFSITNARNLTVEDSEFLISGPCRYALSLGDIDSATIKGNVFRAESLQFFPTSSLLLVTNQFQGSPLIIDGNTFTHNHGTNLFQKAVNTAESSAKALIIHNILIYGRINAKSSDMVSGNIHYESAAT